MTETVTFTTPPTGSEAPKVEEKQEQQVQQQQSGDRPQWLPENMKSGEDLAKAFADTQAALTKANQELAKLKKPVDTKPDDKKTDDKPTDKKPGDLEIKDDEGKDGEEKDAPAIDFAPYQQEFAETGDVTTESREKIAESLKSIFGDNAKAVVDDYVEGAKNRVGNYNTQLKNIAGGDEGYSSLVTWAKDNLPAEEKTAFNKAVNSGDFHAASFAVSALKGKYEAANGKPPKLLSGDGSPTDAGGFKSLHEMKTAMSDPRYQTDPDYRDSVVKRAAISNI